jgi:hypothetical protein
VQTELKGVLHALEEKLAEKRNKVPNSGPPFFFDGSSPLVFSYKLVSFLSLFLSPEIFRVSKNIHNIFSTVFGEHFTESTPGALQSMFFG